MKEEQKEKSMVQKVCEELGISQSELARRLDIGRSSISKWSNGEKIPSVAQVALELMLENNEQKQKLKIIDDFTTLLGIRNKK
ncbi:hypothetical protein MNB_SV-14-1037 [hydrothermal vent metagenome]|uniref:HTH cro/C1-type domain-containing protein n=1 Tax=hydrothermal vent metagenome TaxID=652676 RepID=A0A1W1CD29_9ZZZZ